MKLRALAVAAVLGPAVTAVDAFRVDNERAGFTALVSALVVAFAIVRLAAMSAGYLRSQARERLLRESAVALVAARESKEIYTIAVDAAHALTIGDGRGRTAFGMGDRDEVEILAARGDGADDLIGVHFPHQRHCRGRSAQAHGRPGRRLPEPAGASRHLPVRDHGEARHDLRATSGGSRSRWSTPSLRSARRSPSPSRAVRRPEDLSSAKASTASGRSSRARPRHRDPRPRPARPLPHAVGASGARLRRRRARRHPARGARRATRSRRVHTTFTSILDARAERPGRMDLRLRHRDGSWRDFEAVVTNLVRDPHIRGCAHRPRRDRAQGARAAAGASGVPRLAHRAGQPCALPTSASGMPSTRTRGLERTSRRSSSISTTSRPSTTRWDTLPATTSSSGSPNGCARRPAPLTHRPVSAGTSSQCCSRTSIPPATCATVAERVLYEIARPIHLHGKRVAVRASIGIAMAEMGASAEELLRNADTAMYTAKDAGKGRYSTYEPTCTSRRSSVCGRCSQATRRRRHDRPAPRQAPQPGRVRTAARTTSMRHSSSRRRSASASSTRSGGSSTATTACSIVRRSKEDIVGRRSDEITAGGEDPAQRQMERLVAGEVDRYTVEKQYVCGDGGHVWARVAGVGDQPSRRPIRRRRRRSERRDEAERELRRRRRS